jgi:DNA polymerase III alpha subunit|tara:strand:+ start:1973 stop:2440 length:468 start_codon:yes stop_codon:yes gene_type:complete
MNTTTEQQGIELLYRNKDISDIVFEDPTLFNQFADQLDVEPLILEANWSQDFNIPQHYKDIDVEEYVRRLIPNGVDRTDNAATSQRVEMELSLYKARNLYSILQLMIYIVDMMRKNSLVWGVGRGSSVASYVLYLIGIHKIDSIKYNLNIEEFLK